MAMPAPSHRRLLLIDDEPSIRKLMTLDLSADGYEVRAAADGREGLAVFADWRPDLVLSDIKMPGLDGLEVLRRIKAQDPEVQVILITGHGEMDLAIESLRLDASDFITKPIHPEALEVALSRAQRRLVMQDQLRAYTQGLEEKVAQATSQALASQRLALVGQTVSVMAHAIKNMLSGLSGGAYLLEQGWDQGDPELHQQGLAMLEKHRLRLKNLVRDLLTLAKPRQPLREKVDLATLPRQVATNLAAKAREAGVDLRVAPMPATPAWVEEDAVCEALANLAGNAIEAAATVADGRVELGLTRQQDRAVLWVRDNGPGVAPEAGEHLFQCFYSTKGAGGTGLGLMVCQKTAAEHGGGVDFQSLPGQGAEFRLALPLAQPTRQTDAVRPGGAPRQGGDDD